MKKMMKSIKEIISRVNVMVMKKRTKKKKLHITNKVQENPLNILMPYKNTVATSLEGNHHPAISRKSTITVRTKVLKAK